MECKQAEVRGEADPELAAVKRLGAKLVAEHARCGMVDDREDKTVPVASGGAPTAATPQVRRHASVVDIDTVDTWPVLGWGCNHYGYVLRRPKMTQSQTSSSHRRSPRGERSGRVKSPLTTRRKRPTRF